MPKCKKNARIVAFHAKIPPFQVSVTRISRPFPSTREVIFAISWITINKIHEISYIVNIESMIFHYDFLIFKMKYSFKENLRNELDYQGITVKELSARTGIPIASLDCYLGNRATVPSVVAAVKIAQALDVTVEYLAISKNASTTKLDKELGRETRELINWVKNLNMEQSKSVLKMIKTFKNQVTPGGRRKLQGFPPLEG